MPFKTIDFSKYSSIKIGPVLDVSVIQSEIDIQNDFFTIGGAYNLLISHTPPPMQMLGSNFDFIRLDNNSLFVGCATMSGRMCSFAKKHNLSGFEFLSHLPGTIGGILAMNAGMKEYEIFGLLKRIRLKDGWINACDIEHGYRYAKLGGIALEAEFSANHGFDYSLATMFKKMRENQPKEPSAGSVFKNPANDFAGRLIERVGLKGYRIGDAAFSIAHANFLVNLGRASFDDAMRLIELAQERVVKEFGIELSPEIKVV